MSQVEPHAAEWKNRDRYEELLDEGMTADEIYEQEVAESYPSVDLTEFRRYLRRCKLIEGGKWSPEKSVPLRLNNKVDVFFSFPRELASHSEFPVTVESELPIAYFPTIDTTKTGTKFGLRAVPCDYPGHTDAKTRWSNERKCMNTGSRSLEFRLPRRIAHTMGISGMFSAYSPGTSQLQKKGDSQVVEDGILSSIDDDDGFGGGGATFGDDGDAEVATPAKDESEVVADLSIEDGGVTVHLSPAPTVWTPSSVDDPLTQGPTVDDPLADDTEVRPENLEPTTVALPRSWDSNRLDDGEKTPWNFNGYQFPIPREYVSAYEIEAGDKVRQHYGAVYVDGRRRLAHIIRFDDEADDTPSIRSNVFESSKNKAVDSKSKVITPNRSLLHSLGIGVDDDIENTPNPIVYPGLGYIALLPNPDE